MPILNFNIVIFKKYVNFWGLFIHQVFIEALFCSRTLAKEGDKNSYIDPNFLHCHSTKRDSNINSFICGKYCSSSLHRMSEG